MFCFESFMPVSSWSDLFQKDDTGLCQTCEGKLERIKGEICEICGRSLLEVDEQYKVGQLCYDCYRFEQDPLWKGVLKQNRSLYKYNDFLKEYLSQLKFRGDYKLIEIFKPALTKQVKQTFDQHLLVPIPLSKERLYERGFNQAKALAKLLEVPISEALIRTHSEKQSKKSRNQRLHRQSPFSLNSNIKVSSHSILLIDDIYTTGTTLRQAAKALLQANAKDISAITIARG